MRKAQYAELKEAAKKDGRVPGPAQELEDLIASCAKDPLRYVMLAFPWGEGPLAKFDGPDAWQTEFLRDIAGRLSPNEAIQKAVASGHGVGKSALVAMLILWAMSTMPDTKGVVTANTEVQLKTKTWAELAKWHNMAINKHWFELTATALFAKDPDHERLWRIDQVTWSAHNTEAFAGLHNQDRRILLIFDEASAIDDTIWEVAEGALTDENTEIIWCVFGNPTKVTGRFSECFDKHSHRWHTTRVDSRTCKFTNKKKLQQWVDDWGEDSDFVRVRVKGEPPKTAGDQFIDYDAVQTCRKFKAEGYETLPKIIGVDVARFGEDSSVIVMRQGRYSTTLARLQGLDTVAVASKIMEVIDEQAPDAVVVDAIGLGSGVIDQLKNQKYDKIGGRNILFEFYGSSKPIWETQYLNRRAEVWGLMGEALKAGMQIDDSPELSKELLAPKYSFNGDNKLKLEGKSDMRARGAASPDRADALAYTWAVKINTRHKVSKDEEPRGNAYSKLGWML